MYPQNKAQKRGRFFVKKALKNNKKTRTKKWRYTNKKWGLKYHGR